MLYSYYYLLFLIPLLIQPSQWKVWGILFITSFLIVTNEKILPNDHGSMWYTNRFLIVSFASFLLINCVKTIHAYYQSCIYIATLVLFLILEMDIVFVTNVIHSRYEYYIYGIIIVKFLGITLSVPICNINKHSHSSINKSIN